MKKTRTGCDMFVSGGANMNYQWKRRTWLTVRMVSAVGLAICLTGLSACSGAYGRLAVNSDVKALFERNEVLGDYRYFHSGPASRPRVIIGLDRNYSLQSKYWQPVALTPEKLHRWLGFQGYHKRYFLGGNGSDILDAGGKKIGVWYGLVDAHDWAKVQMVDHQTVSITLPMPRENMPRPPLMRSW